MGVGRRRVPRPPVSAPETFDLNQSLRNAFPIELGP